MDIVLDHHHLATPELDRWKAAQQGHAAVPPTPSDAQKWLHEPKTSTFIIGGGLTLFPTDLAFNQVGSERLHLSRCYI